MSENKRIVIVTGASSGIGKAAAELFAKQGDTVYGLSRHPKVGASVLPLAADVTDEKQVLEAVNKVIADQGRVDILVNNAGSGISGAFEFQTDEEIRSQFEVCLLGIAHCTRAVLPYMREAGSGMIINISSVAGALSIPFQSWYSAVKAGVLSITEALQNEVRPFGIRVTAILPGDTKTGFTAARKKNTEGQEVYKAMSRSVASMEHDEENGMPPETLAQRIVSISRKKNPKARYSCGFKYQFFLFLGAILPIRLRNWILGKMYA